MKINPVLFERDIICLDCESCVNSCPINIYFHEKRIGGILYPFVKSQNCIHCGRCSRACPLNRDSLSESLQETYVAFSTNTDLSQSASGGMFASLAKNVLKDKGLVYGSEMTFQDGQANVQHERIESQEDLNRLLGSKYVHSKVGMTFRQVRADLKAGSQVLYCGTPCQIAGLKAFLGKEYSNLFTIDIVCHGTPSLSFFNQYLSYVNKKYRGIVEGFSFRDKSEGWKLYGKVILNKDGRLKTIKFEPEKSSYYQLFLDRCIYRESCYSCPYAGTHRPGDITIGDYWCIELVHPELIKENKGPLDTDKGCSLLIINNAQGKELINRHGNDIRKWASSYEQAAKYNAQLLKPSVRPAERDVIFRLSQQSYGVLEKWYRKRMRPIRMKRWVRRIIPRTVKTIIKKWFK